MQKCPQFHLTYNHHLVVFYSPQESDPVFSCLHFLTRENVLASVSCASSQSGIFSPDPPGGQGRALCLPRLPFWGSQEGQIPRRPSWQGWSVRPCSDRGEVRGSHGCVPCGGCRSVAVRPSLPSLLLLAFHRIPSQVGILTQATGSTILDRVPI